MSVERKALGDQVVAAIESFSDSKKYNGVGWFFLTVPEHLEKEDNILRVLNFNSRCAMGT